MQAQGALPPPPDYPARGYQPDAFEQGFEPGFGQQGYPQQGYPPPGYSQPEHSQQGFQPNPYPPAPPPYGAPVPPPLPAPPLPPSQPDVSDTVDRMLRPQGLFQQRPYGGQGGFGEQGGFNGQGGFSGQGGFNGQGPFGPEGQYAPQGQYGEPGQYGETRQYGDPGQYGAPGQYGPQGQYGPPPPWPAPPGGIPGPSETMPHGLPQAPRGGGRRQMPGGGRRFIPAIIITAIAIIVVVGVVVVLQSMRGNTSSPPTTAPSSTPTSSSSTTHVSDQAQRQAAAQLAGLLSQSGNDRGAVIGAVDDVQNCGKNLAQDEQTLATAATNRRTLLTRLGSLPGRSTLPSAMVSALTSAWQASAQDDSDLSKWAGDELARGCHKKTVNNDSNYQASLGPDNQATNEKQSFTAQWNPIARRDGLKTYQWEQL